MYRVWILLTAFFFLLCCPIGSLGAGQTLEIPGTGSCHAVLADLAQAFNQDQSDILIIVPPSIGSSGGIREVLADRAELGRVSRQPKPEEIEEGLTSLAFARDLLVFTVGERVRLNQLSVEQLVEIYTGKIKNWSELGEEDMPIRILSRQPGDTNLAIIQHHLKGFSENSVTPRGKILFTDQEMIEMIKKYPSSIGFCTRSELLMEGLTNILTLGDMTPEPEEANSGRYPLVITYYLIFKEKRLGKAGKRFLDYIFSNKGRERIQGHELVPVAR